MSARVLVVDDILANRRLMQAKLEAKYYTVLLAESGKQALRSALHDQPEIILLDVMMPEMDGYEVCRRLKDNPRTRHIPVVMLTALGDSDDRIRGLEAGADDFLTKPVDDFSLIARLGALNRYNAVTTELRKRESTGKQSSAFTPEELDSLQQPGRILVIDSHDRQAEFVAKALREAGHIAFTLKADGSAEATAKGKIDVVFISLSQQSFDPLRLCAHFRTDQATRAISIIVSCDPADQDLAGQALGLGASDVITSPVIAEELKARVNTQLRRTRYVDILRQRVDRGLELSVIDQLTELEISCCRSLQSG